MITDAVIGLLLFDKNQLSEQIREISLVIFMCYFRHLIT